MQRIFALSLLLVAGAVDAAPLPRSTPEAQGVSSAAILEFIEAADKNVDTMNSVMIVRHGQVIAEGWWKPYDAVTPHAMYSLSKSFTSTAVGLAIADGKFSLDDQVIKFFPELLPAEQSERLKQMRVRDLLIMSTGHDDKDLRTLENLEAPDAARHFLALPVAHKPGAHFLYNTPATYMLSAILQKTTGEKLIDYLRPRLFEPLGIENPTWTESAEGISLGGYGLAVKTEDIARFGLLYLHRGEWQGKQLVPQAWVAAATSRQTSTGSNPTSDWDQGYGYQFWQSRHGYRGDGAFGQFCFVFPDLDANIAITSGSRNMQAVMNLVWDHLLPAMKPEALAANPADQKKLTDRLSKLEVRRLEGKATPKLPASLSGKWYAFDDNKLGLTRLAVDWRSQKSRPVLKMKAGGKDQQVVCSTNEWLKTRASLGLDPERLFATLCSWSPDDTFVIKMVAVEFPHYQLVKVRLTPEEAIFDGTSNINRPEEDLHLVGRAQ